MSHAFVRIVVPETRTGGLTQSSYLRLGAYSADEQNLVTNLTTTTSSDSSSSVTAISQAHSAPDPSSTMGQDTASVTDTQTGTYTTQNLGVLAYTDKDFQANVQGAALMKIGNGHTTEVTNGDALYKVDQGGYTLEANNDIKINAGFNGAPANIELTASDYIKQTANGPLSVVTYGNSDSNTIGNTSDFYLGTKFSCMIGADTSLTIAISTSVSIALEFSVLVGGSFSVTMWADNSIVIGDQIQIQEGLYLKQVTGTYSNLVIGADLKLADTSTKIVTGGADFKLAPEDLKKVGVNGTWCNTDVKIAEVELKGADLEAAKSELRASIDDLLSHSGDVEAKSKSAIVYL
jgi:hypothetical protein